MRDAAFCILLVLAAVVGGCTTGTGNSATLTDQPDTIAPVSYGGRAIAIAVDVDEITTRSPEAKQFFLTGLTSSTEYARYNESLKYFDAAIAIDRNFTEAWYAKGVALHNLKRYDEAVLCYDKALALDPQNAAVWSLKAAAFTDSGRQDEAAECYRRAAAIDSRY